MKKMRKIPILIAGLTLFTGITGQSLAAVASEGEDNGRDWLSLTKNEPNEYLTIDLIDYKNGEVRSTVSAPEDEDIYIKTATIAYMNFNQGVTETEADEALGTLTGEKDEIWKIVSFYKFSPTMMMKTRNLILNQSTKVMNAYTNKSDVLYYAVELGRPEGDDWAETWWIRGKVDYRSCIHSKVFDEDTMSCKREENDGEVKYIPQVNQSKELIYPPENESVLTWREEWKSVIQANCEAVQNEVELMMKYFYDGLMVLDQDEEILDGITKSLVNFSSTEDKILWLAQSVANWKMRITELREFLNRANASDSSDTDRLVILEKENEALKAENERLAGEMAEMQKRNDQIMEKKGLIESENRELKEQIAKLMAEKEENDIDVDDVNGGNGANDANSGALDDTETGKENTVITDDIGGVENAEDDEKSAVMDSAEDKKESGVVVGIAENRTGDMALELAGSKENDVISNPEAKGEVEGRTAEEKKTNDEDDIEVPLLGEEEVKTHGFWWWLIPLVGLTGAVILAVKRKNLRA